MTSAAEVQEQILEAVQEALADDRRDGLKGGVRAQHLTDYVDRAELTISGHLQALYDRGELVRVQGVTAEGWSRTSYLPTDHPDAEFPTSAEDYHP